MNRQLRVAMRLATVADVVCGTGWRGHAQEGFGSVSNVTDLANWTADRTRVEIDSGVLTVHEGEGWLRLNKVLSVFVRSWPTFDEQ